MRILLTILSVSFISIQFWLVWLWTNTDTTEKLIQFFKSFYGFIPTWSHLAFSMGSAWWLVPIILISILGFVIYTKGITLKITYLCIGSVCITLSMVYAMYPIHLMLTKSIWTKSLTRKSRPFAVAHWDAQKAARPLFKSLALTIIVMKQSTTKRQKLLNPLTKVIIFSTAFYLVIGIILFGVEAVYYGRVTDITLKYMSGLFFPLTMPFNSVMLYFQRLYDPNTGHVWEWTVFASAFIGIALIAAIFGSIVSKNNTIRKISIRVGIPLVFIWIIGSFLDVLLRYGGM